MIQKYSFSHHCDFNAFYNSDTALNAAGLTSGDFVQVGFDSCNQVWVLAEASVMKCIMAQTVDGLDIGAALQQHLHGVLAAILAAKNQSRPEKPTEMAFSDCDPPIPQTTNLMV